jgi:hypothetical protein
VDFCDCADFFFWAQSGRWKIPGNDPRLRYGLDMDRSRREHTLPSDEGHGKEVPRELSHQEIEDLIYANFSGQEVRQIVEDSRTLNRIIAQGFGVQTEKSLPETDAPPIDRDLLERFATDPESLKLSELINVHTYCVNFECWREARAQAMRDMWAEDQGDLNR